MITFVFISFVLFFGLLAATNRIVPWWIVEEKEKQLHFTKREVEALTIRNQTLSQQVLPTPSSTKKVGPRDREKFWFDMWLENWMRQVGSKYVPLEGAADYVAPKPPRLTKNPYQTRAFENTKRGLTTQEILEGNFSDGFKEFARANATKELQALPMGGTSFEEVNKNMQYLMEVVNEQHQEEKTDSFQKVYDTLSPVARKRVWEVEEAQRLKKQRYAEYDRVSQEAYRTLSNELLRTINRPSPYYGSTSSYYEREQQRIQQEREIEKARARLYAQMEELHVYNPYK